MHTDTLQSVQIDHRVHLPLRERARRGHRKYAGVSAAQEPLSSLLISTKSPSTAHPLSANETSAAHRFQQSPRSPSAIPQQVRDCPDHVSPARIGRGGCGSDTEVSARDALMGREKGRGRHAFHSYRSAMTSREQAEDGPVQHHPEIRTADGETLDRGCRGGGPGERAKGKERGKASNRDQADTAYRSRSIVSEEGCEQRVVGPECIIG